VQRRKESGLNVVRVCKDLEENGVGEELLATRRLKTASDEPDLTASSQAPEPGAILAATRFLRAFQVLLRSMRLYERNHPHVFESLEAAERNLRVALRFFPSIGIAVKRDSLAIPILGQQLGDPRGELKTLAEELFRCGVTLLVFLPETNLGELDVLARLLNSILSGEDAQRHREAHRPEEWHAKLVKHKLSGIRVNTPIQRQVDTALASLIAALLAYGGAPQGADADASEVGPGTEPATQTTAAKSEELTGALHLLVKLTPPRDSAQPVSPQETARAFHAVLAEADRRTISRIVAATMRQAPREEETYEAYIARLGDALAFEFASEEFRAGRAKPTELRSLFAGLGRGLAGRAGWLASHRDRGSGFRDGGASTPGEVSSFVAQWTDEEHAERLSERFWAGLTPQVVANVLGGPDAWCVPVASLRRTLEQLLDAARLDPNDESDAPSGGSSREARKLLLNYARCLESEEGAARRAVAAGLAELHPLLERLWPNQVPEEPARCIVRALERETSPGIAGLLTAVTENLARLALRQADYAGFERIMEALERAPHDAEHAHLTSLAAGFVADDRWLLLVDAALASRPLDPVLPRLLRRDPERLLDRLGLILTAPNGLDALPAMARLLRAIGEPAIGALKIRLFEPRRQRAAAAVKLLVATRPEHVVAALPRALPKWDWSLQDLAVSELARWSNEERAPGLARTFLAVLPEAHPMVVPMMLDQISLAQEMAGVPLLLQIAAGGNEQSREVFIRIKAVEALGRMRVMEAADFLRTILRLRNGLTYVEPAGLRAAAKEALALLENCPSSADIRTSQQVLEKTNVSYTRPRRYPRTPVPSPFAAQIEGPHAGPARVRTISLGGAFLESKRRLAVGDPIHLKIRAGLRRIHSTAVVRNVTPEGGGVEFVQMPQEDREKLRHLVSRLLRGRQRPSS